MTLELQNLSVSLGAKRFAFSLTAKAGETHAIMGKSGSGKSTLLNLVGGFLTPEQGTLTWEGEPLLTLAPDKRPMTTLFQSHNLFDHLSVRQNIGLGLSPNLKLHGNDWSRIDDVLADVGLPNRGDDKPQSLSGGEQQRVGLARCLLRQKPILLLDEPYGALDEATRNDMLALTRSVCQRLNLCVLLVTHDAQDAEQLGAIHHRIVDGKLR